MLMSLRRVPLRCTLKVPSWLIARRIAPLNWLVKPGSNDCCFIGMRSEYLTGGFFDYPFRTRSVYTLLKGEISLRLRLFLAVVVSAGVCLAQDAPSGVTKVTSVEGITEYRLSNGLRLLVFPDPSKPNITVNITYLVGSRHEGAGEGGMAHLLEHMVFKGSPKHTNIPQELTAHGARPNGSTTWDRTNYFETFQATDENLKWALDLESDRMVHSFIRKEDFDKEFSVVRNEFEMGENSPM